MQSRVIDECLQLFGGYGYMNEYLIGRMYVDARDTAHLWRRQRNHEGSHCAGPVGQAWRADAQASGGKWQVAGTGRQASGQPEVSVVN